MTNRERTIFHSLMILKKYWYWEEEGEKEGKGTGNKQYKRQVENRQEEVKYSIGNVEGKELICTTHKHELRWGVMPMGGGVQGVGK